MPTIPEIISKIKRCYGATDSNRTVQNNDENDDMEELDDIDAPKAGSTIEDPPNGGIRAWLIVVSCAVISAMMGAIEISVGRSLVDSKDDTDIDEDDAIEIYLLFLSLSEVYAPVASVSMITLGYELTIHIGSWCMAVSFLILSFVKDIHGIKFLIYITAGIGSGLVQFGILIPVLEYFTTKRIRALMFTKISRYMGRFIPIIIFSVGSFTWREYYRLCMGFSFIIALVGLTVPSLKLKMKSDGRTSFIARTLGMGQMKFIKNAFIWLVCFLFFVHSIAVEPPNAELTNIEDIPDRLDLGTGSSEHLAFIFTPIIGLIVGSFLGWLFKFSAKHKFWGCVKQVPTAGEIFNILLIIMVCVSCLMTIMFFIAPVAPKFAYFFILSILFATQLAFIEEIRDDSLPDVFGKENVKFVQGLLQMCVGIGGIIGSASSVALKWKNSFRMGGGMLLIVTAVSLIMFLLRTQTESINKILTAYLGEKWTFQHPLESQTESASSSEPSDLAADETVTEMPHNNIKLKHTYVHGPSNIRYVSSDKRKRYNKHETRTGASGSTETQYNSSGHTVYTNIQTSMSPVAYNVVQQDRLPNLPSGAYMLYSYNVSQNTETN